ncbi:MAG: hypothetical protein NT084_00520 [Bacteroidetes bacterium]|nr:hypothetical protein [Bacteroidota bacterium]
MRNLTIKSLLPLLLLCLPLISLAQVTTKNGTTNEDPNEIKKTRVLVIPWEPRMFNCNSDISRAISSETSQKFTQIEESLRRGMVDQLKRAFGSAYNVVSLIDDTLKMKDDLWYVYTHTTMSYTPVNFPLNATKADSAKIKQQSGIQKGQVEAQSDDVEKFMNTIVLAPNLLAYLKKKYNADYVLFLNEVDMDNDLGSDPYNTMGKTEYNRAVTMHWTMMNTADGKRVAMGKSKGTFSSDTNSPKKIIESSYSIISKAIFDKFIVGIKPKQ